MILCSRAIFRAQLLKYVGITIFFLMLNLQKFASINYKMLFIFVTVGNH